MGCDSQRSSVSRIRPLPLAPSCARARSGRACGEASAVSTVWAHSERCACAYYGVMECTLQPSVVGSAAARLKCTVTGEIRLSCAPSAPLKLLPRVKGRPT